MAPMTPVVGPGCLPIFIGRVSNIIRKVEGGWPVGTATIKPANDDDDADAAGADKPSLFLEFQLVCTTPDLITVLDTAGSAVAMYEMRYGLMVTVILLPAHPLWTAAPGLKFAGTPRLGMKVPFTPLEKKWQKPRSAFEEFTVKL
ncbi:hypothetical protein SBRCBS47491_004439 [Sporothrix bragantina]|uniref:S-Me-THD-like C-terminal domain-containing protein n=1 Tax=Sporothrix bragantina TaxID=671064 RepID=A0ABP0BNJ9_9PEZI